MPCESRFDADVQTNDKDIPSGSMSRRYKRIRSRGQTAIPVLPICRRLVTSFGTTSGCKEKIKVSCETFQNFCSLHRHIPSPIMANNSKSERSQTNSSMDLDSFPYELVDRTLLSLQSSDDLQHNLTVKCLECIENWKKCAESVFNSSDSKDEVFRL